MRNDKKTNNRNPLLSLTAMVCVLALLVGMVPTAMATETSTEPEETTTVTEATESTSTTEPTETEEATDPTETTGETEAATESTKAASEPEKETDSTEASTEATEPTGETVPEETEGEDLLTYLRNEIAAYMERYAISPEMPDSALANAYFVLDSEGAKAAWDTANDLLAQAENLSTEDADILMAEKNTLLCLRFYDLMVRINSPSLLGNYSSSNGLDADLTISVNASKSDDNSIYSESLANNVLTVNANSYEDCSGSLQSNTVTITVKNNATTAKTLSFSWEATNCDSLTIDGTTSTGKGQFSKELSGGAAITITLVASGSDYTMNVFVMRNISLTTSSASQITINYDSSLGTVTQGESSNAFTSGESVSITSPTAFTATPANNSVVFLGWIDAQDKFLGALTSYSIIPDGNDKELTAVFATTSPWFLVDDTYLIEGLTAACQKGSKVSLANNATLPAGDYIISSGDTLLIPFDDTNTLYTTVPGWDNTYTTPTFYRTLTMESGANITVSGGAISVSGKHRAGGGAAYTSMPTGAVGRINMAEGSSITVNSGTLYAWGYVTGDGNVTIGKGANLYECFQLMDYRGGSQSSSMKYNIFPGNQYYVQNVEAPLTVIAGANMYGYMTVDISLVNEKSTTVPFGGSSGMFNLTSGYMTRTYDGSTDRIIYKVDGDITLSSIVLDIGNMGREIDSAGYVLCIPNNYTIDLNTGTATINQHLALIPGAELIVREEARVDFGKVKNTTPTKVYVYDSESWGDFCFGINHKTLKFIALPYSPSRDYTRTEADLVDAKIQVDGVLNVGSGALYTTSGAAVVTGGTLTSSDNIGANICSTGNGQMIIDAAASETKTYQLHSMNNGQNVYTYYDIPITSAKLKHEDGTYLQSATGTYVYNAEHGKWVLGEHTTEPTITAPTSASLGSAKLECPCGYSSEQPIHVMLKAIEASADAEVILKQKFFVPKELVDAGVYAVLTKPTLYDSPPADYEDETKTITLSELTPDGSGRYVLNMGVASGEMTCPVTVQLFDKDGKELTVLDYVGNAIGTEVSRSVVDYARLALEKGNDRQKALMTALVTYGGYAQINFRVDSSNPAYYILSEFGENPLDISSVSINRTMTSAGSDIGIEMTGTQNAFLDSAIKLQPHFTLTGSFPITDYSAELTYPVGGTTRTKTLEWITNTGKYTLDIENIPAAYLDHDYKITIARNGEKYEITTSVLAYLTNLLNGNSTDSQKNLAKAMYLYNDAANTYFDK